jgi:hypothetical protein
VAAKKHREKQSAAFEIQRHYTATVPWSISLPNPASIGVLNLNFFLFAGRGSNFDSWFFSASCQKQRMREPGELELVGTLVRPLPLFALCPCEISLQNEPSSLPASFSSSSIDSLEAGAMWVRYNKLSTTPLASSSYRAGYVSSQSRGGEPGIANGVFSIVKSRTMTTWRA